MIMKVYNGWEEEVGMRVQKVGFSAPERFRRKHTS